MTKFSSETAVPAAVVTEMRPDVAPELAIDETGISIVVPLEDVTEMDLLRQNLTVIEPANPVPVMVKVPPAPSESVVVDSDEIDGGKAVEVSNDVTPLRPMPEPLPL
jgi:hypothetical protein